MLGNIVILVITWFLLRLEHKQLKNALGLTPPLYRLLQFSLGLLATAILAILIKYTFSFAANFAWVPATSISSGYLLTGLYTVINSVVYEELLFRGYILYKAIGYLGECKANFLSAAAFGIYYWFTFGILGAPVVMAWVFFYTGVWGLMFAYSYSRTRSLALPVGLHLGWNLVDQYVFSGDRLSLFEPVTTIHTQYLSSLQNMLYLYLPTLGFAVIVIVLLSKTHAAYKVR
ncbi:membrane protease YdiL (CAAX protease family) [Pontibacter aydingkolensis]|uniref:CPBP family intramembrane metalloprotease n=1 Tax=Pontibacter aydingkolensis TaxID=1911536 RepID=A0ABS7CXY7_9BACT|nr:CPBP family intramembrane glutamic endopeptidase [Pontibacter aydingkolensis]MBW7468658.1 CPBP family intramembrane metalloprotease [Pontibacter aydingkolensis]